MTANGAQGSYEERRKTRGLSSFSGTRFHTLYYFLAKASRGILLNAFVLARVFVQAYLSLFPTLWRDN